MFDKEVEKIHASDMGIIEASTSQGGKTRQKKSNRFVEEWIKLFPGSSNANATHDHAFINPYALCRDVVCLGVTSSKLFKDFYYNRQKKIPICNTWKKNLAKLISPKVFVDVDLMKALFYCYNLATKYFYRKDGSIFCTLGHESFIEAFGLDGAMGQPIDLEDSQKKFERIPRPTLGSLCCSISLWI